MIIVNFATEGYLNGQRRLFDSIKGYRCVGFSNYAEIKSPKHKASPYEFKIHSIEAVRKGASDPVILWCDASLFRVGDLSKIENIIKRDGYFMEEAGHYVKDWCNDHARKYFDLKQHESGFTMFSAGLLGLDFSNPVAQEFFLKWKASASAGCFIGDWKNHRHDMTCASIIAQRMGLKYQPGGAHMSYIGPGYSTPSPEAVFLLQGIY